MQGALHTMVVTQAQYSGAPNQQVLWSPPFFFQELSGSRRMDTRCVRTWGSGQRLEEEQGGLLDWEEGAKCTRARLVWWDVNGTSDASIRNTSAVLGHRPEQLFWSQVKHIFLRAPYLQPGTLTWMTARSLPYQKAHKGEGTRGGQEYVDSFRPVSYSFISPKIPNQESYT